MARVIFNANEIDQQFQIEDVIRRTLETNRTASVDKSVIESSYELENEDDQTIGKSVRDKCSHIAQQLDLDFSLHEDAIVFRQKPK